MLSAVRHVTCQLRSDRLQHMPLPAELFR